jgi:hypothetical protein
MAGSEHDKMYVIVDGGDVVGHVPADDVAQVKRRVGWPTGNSLNDLFNRGAGGSGHRTGHTASGTRGKKGGLSVIPENTEKGRTRRRSRR